MSIRAMLVVFIVSSLIACGATKQAVGQATPSKTTNTRSSLFSTEAEKLAFLEQYLSMSSAVEETEFHVVYHDNGGESLAGPSDWDIRTVMRVAPDDIVRWTDGLQPVQLAKVELDWASTLLQEYGWTVSSEPLVYEDSGSLVVVYKQDGIVAKRVSTMP